MLLPAPGRAESALGTGVWCRRGGLAPLVAGPGNPGGVKNTHYLFWGFVKGRWAVGDEARRACLLCRGCPAYRGGAEVSPPGPFAQGPGDTPPLPGPERWRGGPGGGEPPPCPPCHQCHSRTLFSVSLSGGRGPERARIWRLLSLCSTRTNPAPQGLSPVPCPQDNGPLLTKEPAHVGERTQAVYSSFFVLPSSSS